MERILEEVQEREKGTFRYSVDIATIPITGLNNEEEVQKMILDSYINRIKDGKVAKDDTMPEGVCE